MSRTQGDGHFSTTRRTLIARTKSADVAVAAKALDEVCAEYHYPLYCYLRRRGCGHHDAEDVLHDFLAGILRQHALERMEEERGRLPLRRAPRGDAAPRRAPSAGRPFGQAGRSVAQPAQPFTQATRSVGTRNPAWMQRRPPARVTRRPAA